MSALSWMRVVGKGVRHPGRATMRLILKTRLARRRVEAERDRLHEFLSQNFQVDADALSRDYLKSGFRQWYQNRKAALARLSISGFVPSVLEG